MTYFCFDVYLPNILLLRKVNNPQVGKYVPSVENKSEIIDQDWLYYVYYVFI